MLQPACRARPAGRSVGIWTGRLALRSAPGFTGSRGSAGRALRVRWT